jgi:hypothetical protein
MSVFTVLLALFILALAYFAIGFIVLFVTIIIDRVRETNLFWDFNERGLSHYSREQTWIRNDIEIEIVTTWPLFIIKRICLAVLDVFFNITFDITSVFIKNPNKR